MSEIDIVTVQTAADLGALVRMLRMHQKMTQTDLATLSGVGLRFISELERGKPSCQLGKSLHVLSILGVKMSPIPFYQPRAALDKPGSLT